MRLTFPIFLQIEGILFKTPTGLISSTASCKLPLQYVKIVICHQIGWKRFLLTFGHGLLLFVLVTKILQGWSLHMDGWVKGQVGKETILRIVIL